MLAADVRVRVPPAPPPPPPLPPPPPAPRAFPLARCIRFLSPNVKFNTTFSLLTAINLGPRQTLGMPLGDDIVDSSPLPPNSVYSDSNGDAGVNLDKIDYSGGDSASSRLAPYSRS
eukprot:tig00000140_g8471.t1